MAMVKKEIYVIYLFFLLFFKLFSLAIDMIPPVKFFMKAMFTNIQKKNNPVVVKQAYPTLQRYVDYAIVKCTKTAIPIATNENKKGVTEDHMHQAIENGCLGEVPEVLPKVSEKKPVFPFPPFREMMRTAGAEIIRGKDVVWTLQAGLKASLQETLSVAEEMSRHAKRQRINKNDIEMALGR